MSLLAFVLLPGRGFLRVAGPDARPFLQGLVTNDVEKLSDNQALYAALLTPQGRFLHDFFLFLHEDAIYLDCEAARADDLLRRLSRHRLRSKVTIEATPGRWQVAAVFSTETPPDAAPTAQTDQQAEIARAFDLPTNPGAARPWGAGVAFNDPRLMALGVRAMLADRDSLAAFVSMGLRQTGPEGYERLRLQAGVPDGSRDMVVEKALLLENGIDRLRGIDWQKGCYMGQELTARTRYRGTLRKRLLPVTISGPLPPPGTPVTLNGQEVGELRTALGDRGLALLRLEAVEEARAKTIPFMAETASLHPEEQGLEALEAEKNGPEKTPD